MVREAWGMSQMTVAWESDEAQWNAYNRAKYSEFLEIVARIAMLLFEGSEMESNPLQDKLEHVLESLFEGKEGEGF